MLLTASAALGSCCEKLREHQLSIKDVAREVRMSPFHFIRQFEALFGLTPHQFRIESRLDQAKLLLLWGIIPSPKFAWRSACPAWASFSSIFARRVAQPPPLTSAVRAPWCRCRATSRETFFPGCLSLMGCLHRLRFAIFEKRLWCVSP